MKFNLNQVEQDFKVSEDDAERKELLLSVMQEWTRRYNDGSLTFIDAVKYQNVAEMMVSKLEGEQ